MNTKIIVVLGVLLLLAGLGLALKKQIEVNGEQRAKLQDQAVALIAAEQQRQDAEKAVLQRDKEIESIIKTNRRLHDEIANAIMGDVCADLTIPTALDNLLRERAPEAHKGLPAGGITTSPPYPAVVR